jgi:hypothetical protein
MKSKAGRKKHEGHPRHVLLRIDESNVEVFDRYTAQERNDIVNRALRTIFPKVPDAGSVILIRPSTIKTETICRIAIASNSVHLIFPEKRDDFKGIVKRFLYAWDGIWTRSFPQSVDLIDRAAEIGNELLINKFCIQVDNDLLKSRIVGQTFVPEAFKLVQRATAGIYKDWFVFRYPKSEDWYAEIMRITAARYADGSIYVPSEHFLEIEDFAEINGFVLSDAALDLAASAKLLKESALIISPRRKAKKKTTKIDDNKTIPAHLRDED